MKVDRLVAVLSHTDIQRTIRSRALTAAATGAVHGWVLGCTERADRGVLMKSLLATFIAILLTGCASGGHQLPSIECRGKGTITGTGNASVMVGSASNSFTIQADCGQDGFTFRFSNPGDTPPSKE